MIAYDRFPLPVRLAVKSNPIVLRNENLSNHKTV